MMEKTLRTRTIVLLQKKSHSLVVPKNSHQQVRYFWLIVLLFSFLTILFQGKFSQDDYAKPLSKLDGEERKRCLDLSKAIMEVEAEHKKKKSDVGEEMKQWVPPYVVTDWEDDKKQKNVVVVVVLPTGVAHQNTTNCDIAVGPSKLALHVTIIWPLNMMDVNVLLDQFPDKWHVDDRNTRRRLALERAFNNLREKETDYVKSQVQIKLPFEVQSKFEFEFVYSRENGFRALMVYLTEPDRKYEGGMKHKMVEL